MGRLRIAVAAALAAAFTIGAGALVLGGTDEEREGGTYSAEAFFAFDVRDKRKLTGFAEHVFLGRVVEKAGSEGKGTTNPGTVMPQTQFRVEVLRALKGEVGGEVVVNQEGGYDPEDKSTMLMEGDPLLEPGKTYLFTTKRDPRKGWLSIVAPGYANVVITSPEQGKRVVGEFEEAIRHQVVPK
ncbi:hypothetical protein AB0J57_13555 [Streptomyces sp. NPDC049837]|uniref:hypothetical protein n=1 Tax=Streptomyces sp. NPDC049837 TaxID=3155277 RepID=UPI00342E106A